MAAYRIYMNGNHICPICASMLKHITPEVFKCVDCKSVFKYLGPGACENELVFKLVEPKKSNKQGGVYET